MTTNPLLTTLFATASTNPSSAPASYYAEFSTAQDAKRFIEKENCSIDYSKAEVAQNPVKFCVAQGTPFSVAAYGSNSLALESASEKFAKYFKIGALAVSIIAAIIMMGTVGRMIADSRRETAVFRAIGAKKFDIAHIYFTYAILLSLMIAAFAILVGYLLASVANHRWSADITLQAINAFNVNDLNKTFTLYGFYGPDMLLLIGLTLVAGVVSAAIPLLRNLRRNPIRDMRDDT